MGARKQIWRDAGLRIVVRVTGGAVELLRVVFVLTIERRELDVVFRVPDKRLRRFKSRNNRHEFLSRSHRWEVRRRSPRASRKKDPGK